MGKKKFIDKKKSATFQLLPRDTSDSNHTETPGSDRVFVRVDNSPYFVNSFFADDDDPNSIFADAPEDETDPADFGRVPSRSQGSSSGTAPLPDDVRKEILELGFPDDGYNYLMHLREIKNTGGGSAFYHNPKAKLDQLPHDVKAYDASRVHIPQVNDSDSNEKAIYGVASKAVGVRIQKAVDPEVVALLDDSDLSRFGSDIEDLEEDFVVQANLPEEGEDFDGDKKLNSAEESVVTESVINESIDEENSVEFVDVLKVGDDPVREGDDCVDEKPRLRRLLDEQFDLLEIQEYGTDKDEDYHGYISEEESLVDKLRHVLNDHVKNNEELDEKYEVPAGDVIDRCVEYAKKYENDSEDEVVVVQESSDESEQWDCETIVSTYSNLDNHPGKIGVPEIARKKQLAETVAGALSSTSLTIALRGKEKLPVEFLPHSRKDARERVQIMGGRDSELPKRRQHGQESKEEKKERKAAVKEERREARRLKKEVKGLYQYEAQRAQKTAAISAPSSIHLM
ncbi:hypothetical protein CFOL_v3_15944 [Cephalotus follicularis]|uniref:Protein LTV1 homolog n=1 Tax=Cephalotus follicularis TaxID=3775 RepID=A0A1Q3BWV5_CEPFO|nr:hypothetical protein CFOL_v3_15944 [Cephalotus follicularis]